MAASRHLQEILCYLCIIHEWLLYIIYTGIHIDYLFMSSDTDFLSLVLCSFFNYSVQQDHGEEEEEVEDGQEAANVTHLEWDGLKNV